MNYLKDENFDPQPIIVGQKIQHCCTYGMSGSDLIPGPGTLYAAVSPKTKQNKNIKMQKQKLYYTEIYKAILIYI